MTPKDDVLAKLGMTAAQAERELLARILNTWPGISRQASKCDNEASA